MNFNMNPNPTQYDNFEEVCVDCYVDDNMRMNTDIVKFKHEIHKQEDFIFSKIKERVQMDISNGHALQLLSLLKCEDEEINALLLCADSNEVSTVVVTEEFYNYSQDFSNFSDSLVRSLFESFVLDNFTNYVDTVISIETSKSLYKYPRKYVNNLVKNSLSGINKQRLFDYYYGIPEFNDVFALYYEQVIKIIKELEVKPFVKDLVFKNLM